MSVFSEEEVLIEWGRLLALLTRVEGLIASDDCDWAAVLVLAKELDLACKGFFDKYDVQSEKISLLIGRDAQDFLLGFDHVLEQTRLGRQKILKEASGVMRGKKVVEAYKKV